MRADARVQYTKTRIKEAFYTLLEKKSIKRISVREPCELAEINRATFYKHYADVFDLMEKLEDETLALVRNHSSGLWVSRIVEGNSPQGQRSAVENHPVMRP